MGDQPANGLLDIGAANAPRPATAMCESCGGPHARRWSTSQGTAHLCPACATLHGLGCP